MPRIDEDFSKISSSFEPLPPGTYRFHLDEIEDQAEAEDARSNPALVFKSTVTEGEHEDRQFYDFVYLRTNEGKKNKIGLGRVKAYAEAILGKDAANSQDGYDTDELIGGDFEGVITSRTYEAKDGSGQKTSADLKKVLPLG
jgi:hypothetical protein